MKGAYVSKISNKMAGNSKIKELGSCSLFLKKKTFTSLVEIVIGVSYVKPLSRQNPLKYKKKKTTTKKKTYDCLQYKVQPPCKV